MNCINCKFWKPNSIIDYIGYCVIDFNNKCDESTCEHFKKSEPEN